MTTAGEAAEASADYRSWRSGLVVEPVWVPANGTEFHGPHPAMRRAGSRALEWRKIHPALDPPVVGPTERLRVLAHTCECLATVYELCSLGGSYFIRKTLRGPDGDEVWETPRVRERLTHDRWFRLLRGLAH